MKITAVFKTHFDIGFTNLAENVLENLCTKMLKDILKVCESTSQNPKGDRYVWTMPSLPLKYMLESDYVPEVDRKRLEALIKNEQIVWHALPFTTHTEFCSLSELVYGLQISSELSERFGRNCFAAKMTDVPGHTWCLPTLLAAAGIKFLHLGCNPSSMPPDVPPLFWWEGPDGSRVLTMYAKGNYGSGVIPPEDWKYPVWLAMTMTNDNMGPHGVEILNQLKFQTAAFDPEAELYCGTMEDFYNDLYPYLGDEVPVIKKDLADSWIHGTGTYPAESADIKEIRRQLMEYELLAAGLQIGGTKLSDNIKKNFDMAYHSLLMFGEHTWGCDVKTHLHSREYEKAAFNKKRKQTESQFAQLSWKEQRQRAVKAQKALEGIKKELSAALCGDKEDRITVIAPCAQKQGSAVRVKKSGIYTDEDTQKQYSAIPRIGGADLLLPELCGMDILRLRRSGDLKTEDKNISFINEGGRLIIDTPFNRAVLELSSGMLVELFDKKSGKRLLGEPQPFYRYEIYNKIDTEKYLNSYIYYITDWIIKDLCKEDYPDIEHGVFYPTLENYNIEEQGDSLRLSLSFCGNSESVEKYGDAKYIDISLTFFGYKPQIDIDIDMREKAATPFTEAAWFILPFDNEFSKLSFSKTGSVVRPQKDILTNCNTEVYCAENFVNLSSGEGGITVVMKNSHLFSFGEQGILKFKKEYAQPAENTLLMNLFNTQWATNFPQWIEGDLHFEFIVAFNSEDEEACIRSAQHLSFAPAVIEGSADMIKLPFVVGEGIMPISFKG